MRIDGDRVYLRELNLEDVNGNYPNWLNDPEICKYNSHGDKLYTKQMAIEYINFIRNSPIHKVFAICDIRTNLHIGNISLQQISIKNKSAEFAIMMGEMKFMGIGLSKEASKLILNYGFNDLDLHRIYCGTSVYNIPMQKLAVKLDLKKEGVSREAMFKNNEFVDIVNYAILKVDYDKK